MSDEECYAWRLKHRERFNLYESAAKTAANAEREEAAAGKAYEEAVADRETVKSDLAAAKREHNLAKDAYDRASTPAETAAAGVSLAAAWAKVEYQEGRLASAESSVSAAIREQGECSVRLSARKSEPDAAYGDVEEAVRMINTHCA